MIVRAVVGDDIYVAQGVDSLPKSRSFAGFRPKGLKYHPFCDDFGPMSLSSVVRFIEQLELEIEKNPGARIIYMIEPGKRNLTNAAFLLGAYMIIKLNMKAQDVSDHFDWIDDSLIEHYRDATFCQGTFHLKLEDCWQGLAKGKIRGWFDATVDGENRGMVHIDKYRHYNKQWNGDFHEVVPGKFIAFKGPKDLAGGARYHDDERGCRTFSPAAYADLFADDFNVAAVVRLNAAEYDSAAFAERGIAHHHLEFADCTCPPGRVVAAFLAAADAALATGGAVAVHCRAGLGRTGTLIAAYLMRSEGFTAREAMGWLRVMRPGSVIGEQQDYLCALESAFAAANAAPGAGPGVVALKRLSDAAPLGSSAAAGGRAQRESDSVARRVAEEVAAGAERRATGRSGRRLVRP